MRSVDCFLIATPWKYRQGKETECVVYMVDFFRRAGGLIIYLFTIFPPWRRQTRFFMSHSHEERTRRRTRIRVPNSAALLCVYVMFHSYEDPKSLAYEGYGLSSENSITAHLPVHAHFLAPESPPPPSIARSSSSLPSGRPTTTSPLHVRSAITRNPEDLPSGPSASAKGVVAGHIAYSRVRVLKSLYRPLILIQLLTSPTNLR